MSEELKPCPHCEGIGSVAYGGWSESGALACVQCQTCKICTESCLDISDAIAAWNHRPIEDKLQARIDALEWLREVEAIYGDTGWIFNQKQCAIDELHVTVLAAREALEES